MTDVEDAANAAFRDFDSPGSTVPHEPVKAEVRAAFKVTSEAILAAATGPVAYPSWESMEEDDSRAAQTLGVVGGDDDGEHSDPVVGGTVPNSGLYAYSDGSPSGWQRIGDALGPQLIIPSEATASGSLWTVTVRSGYTAPSGDLGSRLYVFAAPADSGTSTNMHVVGITSPSDPRLLVSPLLTQVFAGEIKKGATCVIRYRAHDDDTPMLGRFEALTGWVQAPTNNQALFKLDESAPRSGNVLTLDSAFGDPFPNNTGVGTTFSLVLEEDLEPEGELLLKLSGINPLDGFGVKDAEGTIFPVSEGKKGTILTFTRESDTDSFWTALQPWSNANNSQSPESLYGYYYAGASAMASLKALGR